MTDRIKLSFSAAIALGVIYYLLDISQLLALMMAIVVHELGHVLALRSQGLRISCFRLELRGLCMDYRGQTGAWGSAFAAAAGPALGLIYAYGMSLLSDARPSQWLDLTAGISLLLSLFNLLPALPLDGGRIIWELASSRLDICRAERLMSALGFGTGLLLMILGYVSMAKRMGIAPMLAGVWILLYQKNGEGLVKVREIL